MKCEKLRHKVNAYIYTRCKCNKDIQNLYCNLCRLKCMLKTPCEPKNRCHNRKIKKF